MRNDAMAQLRGENPVSGDLRTVSLETLLERIDHEPAAAHRGGGAQTSSRGRRPRHHLGSAVLGAVAVLVALAVAIVGLTTVGHRTLPASARPGAIPGRSELIDILAVLRRPQTKADLDPQLLAMLRRTSHSGRLFPPGIPDLPLIRLATTTPWGEKVFLVPLKPPSASAVREVARKFPGYRAPSLARQRDQETLAVFTINPGGTGGSTCCDTAADIKSLHGGAGTEGYRPLHGSGYTRLFTIVPDGVAKIVYVLPRQGSRIGPGTPIYKHTLTATAVVHGNVATVQINRQCCTGRIASTWYATNGHVLKRVGSRAAANRVVSTPKPGPETPLSRAAEHDPSTPNPVWVTPTAGGPHTQFRLHFRVLLTGAVYHYTYTGTRCPQLPDNRTGGVGGGLQDIRGQLWSQRLSAGGQPFCLGTYHLSVTVVSLGIGRGRIEPPPRPFGTATFAVRP